MMQEPKDQAEHPLEVVKPKDKLTIHKILLWSILFSSVMYLTYSFFVEEKADSEKKDKAD